MSGTKRGGIKAAATNKRRYGDKYYSMIGKLGGQISRGGGFASNPDLARAAGRLGGQRSSRSKNRINAGNLSIPLRKPETEFIAPRTSSQPSWFNKMMEKINASYRKGN